MNFYDRLEGELAAIGIMLTQKQIESFYKYYQLLIEWNKRMNLTAITDMDEVIKKHFVDSLSIVTLGITKQLSEAEIVDIGTGAGFPGIPLKIVFPDIKLLLLDSLNKRITFLNEVTEQLTLSYVTSKHGRAEEFSKKSEYREQFDFAVSRAVARLNSLCELALPFVKVGGSFIAYKAAKAFEETEEAKKAIQILGGKNNSVIEFTLQEERRVLLDIKKIKATPMKYPRAGGKPISNPL